MNRKISKYQQGGMMMPFNYVQGKPGALPTQQFNPGGLQDMSSTLAKGATDSWTSGVAPKAPSSGGLGAAGVGAIAQGVNALGQTALAANQKTEKDQYGVNQVDKGNMQASGALSGAASGAGMGATVGSIIPGVGTAIGAGVGGLIGAGVGLWGGSKDADEQQEQANDQSQSIAMNRQKDLDRQRSAALLAKYGANLRRYK